MIGVIEAAMTNAIRAANAGSPNQLGYTLKKVDTYGGNFDDALEEVIRDFPSVLLAYGGFEKIKETNILVQVKATWAIFCCAASLRNEAAARQGSTTGVGSYQIAEDMIGIICAETFGLKITPIMPARMQPLVNNKIGQQRASIYGVEVETIFTIDLSKPLDANAGDFVTWHSNWDIPTFGNVGTTLPADATADATNNEELPQ